MNTMTIDEVRERLDQTLEDACTSHSPLIISREGREPVVMLPLKDYLNSVEDAGMSETLYLLSSPENAKSLLESIKQANEGKLIYPDPAIFDEQ